MTDFKYRSYQDSDIEIISSCRTSDDEHMMVAHRFLQKLIKEFARLSMLCYLPRYDSYVMPFGYSERQLDSVVLPALSNICKGCVLAELPVMRKERRTGKLIGSGNGRTDYWCIYEGYSIFIEMKGARISTRNKLSETTTIATPWKEMIKQLDEEDAECRASEERTKGCIRIGLYFIALTDSRDRDISKDKFKDKMDEVSNTLCNKKESSKEIPSYAATWILPENLARTEMLDGRFYKGVILISKIFKTIKHKNHV